RRDRRNTRHLAKHNCVALSLCARCAKEKNAAAMNDFSELERALKRLQPVKPSARLMDRVEQALTQVNEIARNVIAPKQFTINWMGLGLGLAAAAAFLILARIDFRPAART